MSSLKEGVEDMMKEVSVVFLKKGFGDASGRSWKGVLVSIGGE